MTSITEDIDDRSPNCHSEVKSDTEDVYEFIEANGKKYRRHFQRRVVIERHKVREVSKSRYSFSLCLLVSFSAFYKLIKISSERLKTMRAFFSQYHSTIYNVSIIENHEFTVVFSNHQKDIYL